MFAETPWDNVIQNHFVHQLLLLIAKRKFLLTKFSVGPNCGVKVCAVQGCCVPTI